MRYLHMTIPSMIQLNLKFAKRKVLICLVVNSAGWNKAKTLSWVRVKSFHAIVYDCLFIL
jgi:hypothetical protein